MSDRFRKTHAIARVSVQRSLRQAAEQLAGAGVPSPRVDAELLASYVLGTPRSRLLTVTETPDEFAREYASVIERRVRREPLQHITGEAHFRHITLAVGPGVFVPRPETEQSAGAAIAEAEHLVTSGERPRVVDLYAGSGAIALAVADEVPPADVHAVEAQDDAVAWLRRNAAGTAVAVHHEDVADAPTGSLREIRGSIDVVIANPPYVPTEAVIRDPEVAAHDPAAALWSGKDGLDDMRVLERVAFDLLKDDGLVVAEHADAQGESAPDIFRSAGRWAEVADHHDLAGRPRYLTARAH